ncbi:hypothetical protein pEaSNUABM12_00092 [Erwinia phage pEa_SNUABM_12]|uniref:Uncharacterized protein n=1 Tax=Erwinia phage pEa_SNUABM_12 TaxID=2768773 RepID=A0A7L8ZLC3_9CAUD|nr:hypothetical protein pEaSNUABM12_00092 [Erwinia phage pEa_SNUABM_12]QXO11787.1 hypothetical protein pEaSNUABM44_00091 [Erwinia phage pEa_SNUABM_44]
MSTKIPEKFYVSRVYRSAEEILGFMVVADNESTKTFQKAKERADGWTRHNKNPLDAIYVDNKPRSGFRLVTNVSRYSTSNVVWRIMHPEGFEFEITSDNMCDLLETNTIVEGEFQDELFFTHNRKLVNQKTKLFAEMIRQEEKKKATIEKVKELEPGCLISVPNQYSYRNPPPPPDKYVYCGKFHSITVNRNKPMVLGAKSSLRYVVREVSTGNYYCLSKISDAFTPLEHYADIDREKVIKEFNEQIRSDKVQIVRYYQSGYVENAIEPLLINDKPFTKDKLKMEFIKQPMKDISVIDDTKIYVYNEQRVFGFGLMNNGGHWYVSTDKNAYSNHSMVASKLLVYPISCINEQNVPQISVDLSEHKGIDHYSSSGNVFGVRDRYGRSGSKPELRHVDIPENIEVGYYTLGE